MNRVLAAGLIAATVSSACGPRVRPTDVVARVDGHELTAAHLEALAKAMPAAREPAVAVPTMVAVWIDFTLAADAFAGGLLLADSAFMAEVMAPRQAEETLARLQAALAARRPGLPPGEADSLYASDSVRTLRQILIPVSNWSESSHVAASKKVADSVLALLSAGRPFSAVARRYSAAIGPYGGAISVVWRRTAPARVWPQISALKPGGTMAGRLREGFVIVHRTSLEDARSELAASLLAAVNAHGDSIFADSVATARHLRVAADGVSRLRSALNTTAAGNDTATLASFQGGGLTTRRAFDWLGAIQDLTRGTIDARSDSGLARILPWMARSELLAHVARELGVDVTWKDLAGARAQFVAALAPLQNQFRGLDETRTRKVDSLVVALGRGESVPTMPGILSQLLRRRATLAINQGPMSAVIDRLRLSGPPQPAPSTASPFGQ